jgi:hypothetical protein
LLAVIADFLIRVLIAVETEKFPDTKEFWREWQSHLGKARTAVTEAIAVHDLAALRSALTLYFSFVDETLSDNRIDQSVTLSDPQLAQAVGDLLGRTYR